MPSSDAEEGKSSARVEKEMDIEGNKKGCCYYINSIRIKKEKVCLLLIGVGDLVTIDADEADTLNAFFSIKIYQVFVPTYKIWGGEEQPGWKMFNSGSLDKVHVIR